MKEQIKEAFRLSSGQSPVDKEKKKDEKPPSQDKEKMPLGVKIIVYGSGAILLIWASGYLLDGLAGMVRGFKNLKRSIKEK